MTDEEIIDIRKSSRSKDVSKPWGDTLDFARALLKRAMQSWGANSATEELRLVIATQRRAMDEAVLKASNLLRSEASVEDWREGLTALRDQLQRDIDT